MSSQDDDKVRMFLDNAPNMQKNPQFIDFLSNSQDNPINGAELSKSDYVAIFIALMETVFFPLILLAFVLIGLSLVFSFLA